MKIENGRPVAGAGGVRRGGAKAGEAEFAPEAGEETPRAAAASSVGPVASLDAVLALQGIDLSGGRRSRQLRRGREALDALERLEIGLITGRAPGDLRGKLAALRNGSEITGEPELDAVLREIDTRVAVELAKLEKHAPAS